MFLYSRMKFSQHFNVVVFVSIMFRSFLDQRQSSCIINNVTFGNKLSRGLNTAPAFLLTLHRHFWFQKLLSNFRCSQVSLGTPFYKVVDFVSKNLISSKIFFSLDFQQFSYVPRTNNFMNVSVLFTI